MLSLLKFNSLIDLVTYFDTEIKCRRFLRQQRWGETVVCPYCGCTHCYECGKDCKRFKCSHCGDTFSVKVGTIFEDSNLPLRKWFMAMYLISSHKKGISSFQLARDIHTTQKTAWFLLHKIRTLYAQNDSVALDGEVECDEMYLGGRETNKHESKKTEGTQGRSTKTKTPIFGMMERENGRAVVIKVENAQAKTLMPIIKQFVKDNAHIFTDELVSYKGLSEEGYLHDVIQHGLKMFSDGNGVTTNSIEGFWGHFKRMVFGIYHFVSVKYLQRYIDEAVYRWNTRKADESARFADMFHKSLIAVTYKDVRMDA